MKKKAFKELFKVQFFHNYFEENSCTCLTPIPSESTKNIAKRFGLKLANDLSGFSYFAYTDTSATDFLTYTYQTTRTSYFDFYLENTDSNFPIYTELPINRKGQLQFNSAVHANSKTKYPVVLRLTLSEKRESMSMGYLRLYFKDIIDQLENGNRAVFDIRFQARATQWRYYIVNQSKLSLERPEIRGKSAIYFSDPESIRLANGQKAIVFTSGDTRIPLSNIPKYKFSLVNSKSTSDAVKKTNPAKTIFKGLPNPDPGRIQFTREKGEEIVYSPMYVYI